MKLDKFHTDSEFATAAVPLGELLTYLHRNSNGKIWLRYKDANGRFGNIGLAESSSPSTPSSSSSESVPSSSSSESVPPSSSSSSFIPSMSLVLTAEQDNSTVSLEAFGSPITDGLIYSADGIAWQPYTCGTSISLQAGESVRFYNTKAQLSVNNENYVRFKMTGKIAATGNIQSMLNASDACSAYCYSQMFYGCTSLTSAPALPATTLANSCYHHMFRNCTSLTSAPALPATTLAISCYHAMFFDCASLTSAPALPAKTMLDNSYNNMFNGCTSLTSAPALPATTLANSCYNAMFYGCTKISSVDVSFTSWLDGATASWLLSASSTGTFIRRSADLPLVYGASNIPNGWTVQDEF